MWAEWLLLKTKGKLYVLIRSAMTADNRPWNRFWNTIASLENSCSTPEGILASTREAAAAQLMEAGKNDEVSLFAMSWAAHSLATSAAETAAIISGCVSFGWRQKLGCLFLLEAACTCENGCLPIRIEELNSGAEKTKSPFFPLLVQSALSALHQAVNASVDVEVDLRQLEQATLLEFVEQAVLPDMLGREAYQQVQEAVAVGIIPENVRSLVEASVQLWTSMYAADSTYLNPLIMFSSTVIDDAQRQEMIKLLAADTTSARLEPTDLLRGELLLNSIDIPFARPFPPPSLPLVGYAEDDFEALTEEEEADLLNYLHAELIWCTPSCNRLILLPDDEDDDDEASAQYRRVLEVLQDEAFTTPLAPIERRQVMELLSGAPELAARLMLESGLTPQTLPSLVEHNPLVAYECLLHILQAAGEEEKNEYLSSLVGMDMSLHSMEVVNRLATHNVAGEMGESTPSPDVQTGGRAKQLLRQGPLAIQPHKPKPILHPEYIHLFIGSCIASCENVLDRHAQNRLVRLVCVFIQSLLRNGIVETEDIYFEVQSFCVEFSRIREASALFKSLKQQNAG